MNNIYCYNNDVQLWVNARESYRGRPNGGPIFSVYNGLIGDPHEILAKCKNQAEALKIMRRAGFRKVAREKSGRVDFKA